MGIETGRLCRLLVRRKALARPSSRHTAIAIPGVATARSIQTSNDNETLTLPGDTRRTQDGR